MKAVLNWVASPSKNIVLQSLTVGLNGIKTIDESLTPDVSTFEFDVAEGDSIHVELRVSNGVLTSDPTTLDAVAPNKPESATDLTLTFKN